MKSVKAVTFISAAQSVYLYDSNHFGDYGHIMAIPNLTFSKALETFKAKGVNTLDSKSSINIFYY